MQNCDINYRLFLLGDSTDENKNFIHSLVGSNYQQPEMLTFIFNKKKLQ